MALLAGCGGPGADDAGSLDTGSLDAAMADAPTLDSSNTDAGAIERFEVLGEVTVTVLEVPRRVELIRAHRAGGVTYMAYVHAQMEPAPLVIVNQPYAGIDWTGEEVDDRWAAAGDGLRPDVDAPDYDGDDLTRYELQSVQAAAEDGAIWLFNGAAVIEVYGRFYAGGDLLDDATDAATAYAFAASRPGELQLDHIGSYGRSWGGMMSLFGAALAQEAHPIAIAALSPPSDFLDLYQHSDVEMPVNFPNPVQAEAFFSPYWRRAAPAIGRPPLADDPRAIAFTPAGLCDAFPAQVMVIHDDWDLLIPARETEALAVACGGKVEPIFWRRGPIDYASAALDHGPYTAEPQVLSAETFATLHLLHALLPESAQRLTLAYGPALEVFLTLIRDARADGENVDFALGPLRSVADARVQLFDPTLGTFTPGAEVLAPVFNTVFGTALDAAGLRTQLALGWP